MGPRDCSGWVKGESRESVRGEMDGRLKLITSALFWATSRYSIRCLVCRWKRKR